MSRRLDTPEPEPSHIPRALIAAAGGFLGGAVVLAGWNCFVFLLDAFLHDLSVDFAFLWELIWWQLKNFWVLLPVCIAVGVIRLRSAPLSALPGVVVAGSAYFILYAPYHELDWVQHLLLSPGHLLAGGISGVLTWWLRMARGGGACRRRKNDQR